ncbi:MAG: dethiobiotin synthase [Gammaproteobacteria bacterium]|nr:dethiobiotin synthase [Gammaproteobacteria bacterium]NND54811.1 dethiobiotin synthase [Gammaproteobacteria bacterium]
MKHSYFVTGTDTGVGKTLIANALLKLAHDEGLSTLGLKPVAAGCYLRDEQLVNEDAWELMQHSSIDVSYTDVNPVALREPMAPHIAAERETVTLAARPLADHCREQVRRAEFCIIEGAGGWQVPLNDHESMADIATGIGAPVILVVGMRLGCINHSLLTVAAVAAAGLKLAGWVANHIDADMAVADANVAALEARIKAPLLGTVPALDNPAPVFAAPHLSVGPLVQSL